MSHRFEIGVHVLYNQWMVEEIHETTPSNRIKRPSYSKLAEWVKIAWETLDPNLIKNSFKCCKLLL
ncbi:7748_t:CDS:2 [Funneliformis mosseae]|uniref:7748_t:CDS:1 n=1 Tax=Funneliformis mosseae TaxID=27381 RepID=A0A9N8ZC94_FUNMO|nr:7748_t:CDS:2 [Funneliformis mosseae]